MKKNDVSSNTQKHLLFKHFIAWSCNGCNVAPLTDYINNPIYQELPTEKDYFDSSDETEYILILELATAIKKKWKN